MKFTGTDKIVQVLDKCDFVIASYLLGSADRGELRFDSDVDLALLLKDGMNPVYGQLRELSLQLSEAAGRMVDISVLSSRNLIYVH